VLIDADNLRRLIDQPGFPDTLAPSRAAAPLPEIRHVDPPGPKGGEKKPANLAWDIAEQVLNGDAKPLAGRGRLTELARRVQPELEKEGHKREIDSITKYIREAFKKWQRENPDK
jgi:hypothetical protein